jgi:putative flavoprotein involved in K+ transport
MRTELFDVVIVGGGQAGLALSYYLTEQGRSHIVLEQDRIVESWRSKRWDSLRLIAPNWSLRLPGFEYDGDDPDGFMGKDEVVARLETYARSFAAPVREGVRVTAIERGPADPHFLVRTQGDSYRASQVVLATGALQQPRVPACAARVPANVTQVVAPAYRNPQSLPPGAVLVVGSGETGCQIAEELVRAGRRVFLAGGRSWWEPRRYRGRDIAAWMRLAGWFERTVDELPPGVRTGQSNPQLTGGDGGHDISGHTLAREGTRLLGRLQDVRDGRAVFAADLEANLAWGDEQARSWLQTIDYLIAQQGLEAPHEDWPDDLLMSEDHSYEVPTELDLADAGITTVIWAMGYRPDLEWVGLPFLDTDGYPIQRRGVTRVPGLYILGLDWLHTARSGLFTGVGEDAAYLAAQIAERASAA